MTRDRINDPIDNEISDFLIFFNESLSDLKFPDVSRESLEALAQGVRDRSSELDKLNERVQAARQALDQANAELRRAALRGLAYARVYADGDPDLSDELAGLALSRDTKEPRKPRRKSPGRQKKAAAQGRKTPDAGKKNPVGELPFDSEEPSVTEQPSVTEAA